MNIISLQTGTKESQWQAPPAETSGEYKKGWLDELVQNGDRWVQAQEGTRHMQSDIKLLIGYDQDNQLKSNTLQPNIRTFVETITDLRQIATLGAKAEQWKKNVAVQNNILKYIYWDSQFVWNTRRTLQYSILGSGFTWLRFSRSRYGWGKARNVFHSLGAFEVLPEQLPPDNDVQGCYAATVIVPMPVAEAHARFPKFQHYLQPIGRYDWNKYNIRGGVRLDFWDRSRFSGVQDWENRYCEIRYHWIRDLRINEEGYTMQMGHPAASWGYTVPSYGDLLVSSNPFNQLPESRKADEGDCRVYPHLRLMMSCPTVPVPMYDDTAFDWHGEIPLAQYDVNDWPWAARGYSAVRNVASLERARRARLSEIDEVLAVRKDPPTGYDFSAGVSRTQLEKLDLLNAQGIRIGLKGDPKKAVTSILPDSIQVDSEDWKGQEFYDAAIKASLGMNDIASMRDLKMNLTDQQFEKFITNLGPMAKGIAINMWRGNTKLAHMLKYNIAQYISVSELEKMVGPEAVEIETYDNDPNSIVPGRLPGEDPQSESKFTKKERAQWFLEYMSVISTPAQLLDITQMQEKMLAMFLYQKSAQLPQSWYMEKFNVQGYEALHQEWKQEQITEAEWKLEVQVALAKKAKELGIEIPPEQGPGQGKGGGRPGTSQREPHASLKGAKSGNVRAVNKQSS